ncbi:Hypothetical predicted protein, partial [Pelobates cultripes]
ASLSPCKQLRSSPLSLAAKRQTSHSLQIRHRPHPPLLPDKELAHNSLQFINTYVAVLLISKGNK